jgi:hypothetical protein
MRSSESHKGTRKVRAVAHGRSDDGNAFIKDPWGGAARARTNDDLAETLAEQFVGSATTAQSNDAIDDVSYPEETGGPFITTRANLEFARGVDASNPIDAEPAALPTATSGAGLFGEALDEQEDEDLESDSET